MVSRKEEGREDGGKKAMQSIQVLHHTLHPDLFFFEYRKTVRSIHFSGSMVETKAGEAGKTISRGVVGAS
jgi:hypothetical protein